MSFHKNRTFSPKRHHKRSITFAPQNCNNNYFISTFGKKIDTEKSNTTQIDIKKLEKEQFKALVDKLKAFILGKSIEKSEVKYYLQNALQLYTQQKSEEVKRRGSLQRLAQDNNSLKLKIMHLQSQKNNLIQECNGYKNEFTEQKKQSTDPVPSLIYTKAKNSSYDQFARYYQGTKLSKNLLLCKVKEPKFKSKFFKKIIHKAYDQTYIRSFDQFVKNSIENSPSLKPQQKSDYIDYFDKLQQKQCSQPCCKRNEASLLEEIQVGSKNFLESSRKAEHSFYYSNKYKEYESRYYRKTKFNPMKIVSIAKTKTEEMEDLEKNYKLKKKSEERKNNSKVQSQKLIY